MIERARRIASGKYRMLISVLGLLLTSTAVIPISAKTLPRVPASVASKPELKVPFASSGDTSFANCTKINTAKREIL